ncbi:MAG: ORF6N domain-containing protein [Betaproteobacteria bacterium]
MARNRQRFPDDCMFQLSAEEYAAIRSQFVTGSKTPDQNSSQSVTSSQKHRVPAPDQSCVIGL